MKKLLFLALFLGLTLNCSSQENLPGEDYKTEVPVLNEELRQIRKDINLARDTFNVKYIYFLIPDDILTTGADKVGRIYVNFAGTIQQVDISVKTAPTGANLIVDLNLNGSTVWSTQASRATIVASANTGTQSIFNTTTFVSDQYFTVDIDQVGSTVAGAKLVIRLKVLKK